MGTHRCAGFGKVAHTLMVNSVSPLRIRFAVVDGSPRRAIDDRVRPDLVNNSTHSAQIADVEFGAAQAYDLVAGSLTGKDNVGAQLSSASGDKYSHGATVATASRRRNQSRRRRISSTS